MRRDHTDTIEALGPRKDDASGRLHSITDLIPVGVLVADRAGRVLDVNQEWLAMSGLSRPDSLGTGWLEALHPLDRGEVAGRLGLLGTGREVLGRHQLYCSEANGRWVHVCAMAAAGSVVIAVVDITDEKTRPDLVHRASHDPLTGVLNRDQFAEHARHAIAALSRRSTTLAALVLDLDHFKEVNDRFGHEVGDAVLVAAASRLRQVLHPADIVARFEGDEFVVLCEDLRSRDAARRVAARILDASKPPLLIDAEELDVGWSLGIAFAEGPGDTSDAMLTRADRALYLAKQKSKGRCAAVAGKSGGRWVTPGPRPARGRTP